MILVSIAAALILALVMLIAYKLANRPETYQPKFAATLVVLALVSVILMDLIQSNIALSLGMLGSLSIVRFRRVSATQEISALYFGRWPLGLRHRQCESSCTKCSMRHGQNSDIMSYNVFSKEKWGG